MSAITFIETLCIVDGNPRHIEWHQLRVDETLLHVFGTAEVQLSLREILQRADIPGDGLFRCRISYSLFPEEKKVQTDPPVFISYVRRPGSTLKLIELPEGYDYQFKYADRRVLDECFVQKSDADDVLLTRRGMITDTTIANIALRKGDKWYTPDSPLLNGTTRRRLVRDGVIIPRTIHLDELEEFDAFKVFNALNDWSETPAAPIVSGILR
jgi:4-amino-4-deoxychorismate lyase